MCQYLKHTNQNTCTYIISCRNRRPDLSPSFQMFTALVFTTFRLIQYNHDRK